MAFTVSRAIKWWAWDKPDRVALNYEGEIVSYADLYAWGIRIAAWLREHGIGPQDRVMMVAENSLEYAMLLLGTTLAGGISAPVTFRSSERELAHSIKLLTPTLIFTDRSREEIVSTALGAKGQARIHLMEMVRSLRDAPAPSLLHEAKPDDPMFIIGTSGSTGTPKGVVYTQGSTMVYAAEFAIMEPATGNGGSVLAAGPYSSASGTLLLHQFLSVGATIFAENKFTPERALKMLTEHKLTTFLASTIFYERIAALPEFENADLSTVKFAQISGSRVSTQLLARYAEKGITLRQAYGCTEAGGAWAARNETAFTDPEKCGPGALFTEYAVLTPQGEFAPAGEAGEILIRSPALAAGYWADPEQTARTFRDGWLHTGDRGVQDERGNLTFIDRIKDIIISGGLNVSAMEVESTIAEIDGVIEVVVLAAKDAEFGETPLAVIHSANSKVDVRAVLHHCRQTLSAYKVPRYVVFEPTPLPRLPSGKIAKVALRDKYKEAPAFLERVR
ncbi:MULTISPECIES: class I adenylate-forming enzyme family protein [unclassified Novosphingobium]|uniref:class I adenylate-forming enzyme family protein n=1 Tax=unclassified Novosphingobium TaxID=2644732 RepID=UPI000D3111B5|nr:MULTISPECIES: class I adenylate-forming enzyme family protein [unclassified Novosphingobium]PTR12568.1 fatty-acyl-CoA synthase [Novosphingobium sp. GV055]PUB06352.1 fatty-acyl-CoA synthase [Novosphingobium sp. GV061]PUB22403.1 fatty-acyl-CoA synthase [Novosphingobium sp. GV079]PUB44428.1 fatty-acyl-CoA synthase [Novosphingobium sp. GV027]